MALNVTREESPDKSRQQEARWWSQSGSDTSGMEPWNSWQGVSRASPHTSSNSSSVLTILRPPWRPQLPGSLPSSPAEMGAIIPSLRKYAASTTPPQSPKCINTTLLKMSKPDSQQSSTASRMPSLRPTTSSTGATTAWKGDRSPTWSDISRTGIPSPHQSVSSEDAVEMLITSALSMTEH